MRIVPIDIIPINESLVNRSRNAISFLNNHQNAFEFSLLEGLDIPLPINNSLQTTELYKSYDNNRSKIKGYHPNIILVTIQKLKGKKLSNLFGSMESKDQLLTGKAITTTYRVGDLLENIPLDVYLVFEFISFAIRFLGGRGMIHREKKYCPFDSKILKKDIYDIMQYGRFCLECNKKIRDVVTNEQMQSIRKVIGMIGDISFSETPLKEFLDLAGREDIIDEDNIQDLAKLLDQIVFLIQNSQTHLAIEELSSFIALHKREHFKEISLQYSRITRLNFEQRAGVISLEERNKQINKINLAILELVEKLR